MVCSANGVVNHRNDNLGYCALPLVMLLVKEGDPERMGSLCQLIRSVTQIARVW
ncbi:hypothetical protein PA08_0296 [Cutibacterium modestum P08]|uniref:Uncharacterized protein n=1 Tax=Cutibacterium modestum HL044PA1 TaxID=765109 RepID=A0ABN0C563_9ACTN|nr:hypothetical protein HMPREF9607_01468 [Cutibacterium modestum HL044PA1]EGG28067.1 hypothetical protein PA08_0296 [Cutibacterium modestum P08]